jgi:hypothetical protein
VDQGLFLPKSPQSPNHRLRPSFSPQPHSSSSAPAQRRLHSPYAKNKFLQQSFFSLVFFLKYDIQRNLPPGKMKLTKLNSYFIGAALLTQAEAAVTYVSAMRTVTASVDFTEAPEGGSNTITSSSFGIFDESVEAGNVLKTINVVSSQESEIDNSNLNEIDFTLGLLSVEATRTDPSNAPGDLEDNTPSLSSFMFQFEVTSENELFEFVLPISFVDQAQQASIFLEYELVMDPDGTPSSLFSTIFETPNQKKDEGPVTQIFSESQDLAPGVYKFTFSMTAEGSVPNDQNAPISMSIIPEPSSSLLLLVGCLGLASRRTR